MKVKSGFVLKDMGDSYLIIAVGDNAAKFNGAISVNYTGMLLWNALKQNQTVESLCDILINEFKIDKNIAIEDVEKYITRLKTVDLLDD